MKPSGEVLFHRILHDGSVLPVPSHVEITGTEGVKTPAENRRVQKFVLRKNIQSLVCHGSSRQKHPIFRNRTQSVHGLGCRGVVGLDFVTFIADNHVRLPSGQFLFQPPCRLVVDDKYLKSIAGKVLDGFSLFCATALKDSQRIGKSSEFPEFL